MYGTFWDKKIQGSSARDLEKLQLKSLKRQVAKAYEDSKFYRRKFKESGVKPSTIKTLEDVQRLPFVSRQELETHFDDILCVPSSRCAPIRMTSGTTGHPLKVAHSRKDIELIANASAPKPTHPGGTH